MVAPFQLDLCEPGHGARTVKGTSTVDVPFVTTMKPCPVLVGLFVVGFCSPGDFETRTFAGIR